MDTIELSTIFEVIIAALMLFNALVAIVKAAKKISIGSKILYSLQAIAYVIFPAIVFMPDFVPPAIKIIIEFIIIVALSLSLLLNIRGKV